MMKKTKLALALCGLLVGGVAAADSVQGSGSVPTAAQKQAWKQKREQKKAELLQKYDTNHDGKLDANERKVMIDDRATEAFKQMDANGDGVVTLDELKAFKEKQAIERQGRRAERHGRRGLHRSIGSTGTK